MEFMQVLNQMTAPSHYGRGKIKMKIDLQLLEFAKSMRHTATDAEHFMWQILRAKRFMNLKFRRQHVITPYIVDFYCYEINLFVLKEIER